METILQKIIQFIFIPRWEKLERTIGYALRFHQIPDRFVNGWVRWTMTGLWKKEGLKIIAGANYWTIGKIVDGVSSRYLRDCPEYQAWLGGYTVKLEPGAPWTLKDHLRLAVADQKSWLRHHGDPNPLGIVEDSDFTPIDTVRIGEYSGTLYEGEGTTHSDVGNSYNRVWFYIYLAAIVMASMFNFSNPALRITSTSMKPRKVSDKPYETLKIPVYLAIFNIDEDVAIILYGNGAIVEDKNIKKDYSLVIKNDLLEAIRSCEIIKV